MRIIETVKDSFQEAWNSDPDGIAFNGKTNAENRARLKDKYTSGEIIPQVIASLTVWAVIRIIFPGMKPWKRVLLVTLFGNTIEFLQDPAKYKEWNLPHKAEEPTETPKWSDLFGIDPDYPEPEGDFTDYEQWDDAKKAEFWAHVKEHHPDSYEALRWLLEELPQGSKAFVKLEEKP